MLARMSARDSERSPSQRPSVPAKTLPKVLPQRAEPPALVPARMVNEVLYCERLMFLEWVQGEFEDNELNEAAARRGSCALA